MHCSRYGTELGWLLNPEEESVLAVFPGQKIEIYEGDYKLPIIEGNTALPLCYEVQKPHPQPPPRKR